jgi:hypothetical protein
MPYADKSKYVLASKTIPEIARCYFDGDTDKAADDALLAAQDGELRIYSDESVWGETTPFNHIDKDVWYRSSIDWSGRRRLYLRRADLLKIYPDLWKPATSAVPPEPAIEDRGDDDNAAAPQETAPTPQENDERPEDTPPYLAFMLRAAREMGLGAGTRTPKKTIEVWLQENWPDQLGELSERKIKNMATSLRHPKDERGGYFKPNRDE